MNCLTSLSVCKFYHEEKRSIVKILNEPVILWNYLKTLYLKRNFMSGMYPFITVKKGKGIFGIVELPDSGESFPAIIMLHGFEGKKN